MATTKENVWRKLIKVKGNSLFPMDMLRYDRCYPYKSEDATKLDFRMRDNERTVTLVFVGLHRGDIPTVERWESFGWIVTDIEDMP